MPSLLRELHGESPRLGEILAAYAAALAAAAAVFLLGGLASPEVGPWRRLVVAALALDLAGGAVACFTASTAAYYARKPALRRIFIGIHVVHPAILAVLFRAQAVPLVLAGVYAVGSAFAVDSLGGPEARRVAAPALVGFGIALFGVIAVPVPLLAWFAPLFLVKLVLGFAARR
jgi:hypothetical protein